MKGFLVAYILTQYDKVYELVMMKAMLIMVVGGGDDDDDDDDDDNYNELYATKLLHSYLGS